MAINQIWKQQLTLVTYGNEFLNHDLSFNTWINHPIFDQHIFEFRDLQSQHLLAQHFHIWLEALKKQGVKKLSLHNSSLLIDEQNPNANVELLAYPHFIVSHSTHKKTAWILGKELPEWYYSDEDYKAPTTQTNPLRKETFWCYELNPKLAKRLDNDFVQPQWDEINTYIQNELFKQPLAQGFVLISPHNQLAIEQNSETPTTTLETKRFTDFLPRAEKDNFASYMLRQLESLSDFVEEKIQHPVTENNTPLHPEAQLELRNYSKHIDDITAKFVTKTANHYLTAKLEPIVIEHNPLDATSTHEQLDSTPEPNQNVETDKHKTSVLTLICITIIICLIGYYFGL